MSGQEPTVVVYDFGAVMGDIHRNTQTCKSLLNAAGETLGLVSLVFGDLQRVLDPEKMTDADYDRLSRLAESLRRFNDNLTITTAAIVNIDAAFQQMYTAMNIHKRMVDLAASGPHGTA